MTTVKRPLQSAHTFAHPSLFHSVPFLFGCGKSERGCRRVNVRRVAVDNRIVRALNHLLIHAAYIFNFVPALVRHDRMMSSFQSYLSWLAGTSTESSIIYMYSVANHTHRVRYGIRISLVIERSEGTRDYRSRRSSVQLSLELQSCGGAPCTKDRPTYVYSSFRGKYLCIYHPVSKFVKFVSIWLARGSARWTWTEAEGSEIRCWIELIDHFPSQIGGRASRELAIA